MRKLNRGAKEKKGIQGREITRVKAHGHETTGEFMNYLQFMLGE